MGWKRGVKEMHIARCVLKPKSKKKTKKNQKGHNLICFEWLDLMDFRYDMHAGKTQAAAIQRLKKKEKRKLNKPNCWLPVSEQVHCLTCFR